MRGTNAYNQLMLCLGLIFLALAKSESIWVEAESFGPLKGANFSFMMEDGQTRGSWSVAGPDVAAAWTQGGESGFMSIAARADEPAGTRVSRKIVVPAGGAYRLWVRYADYRVKEEAFTVQVRQGEKVQSFEFGLKPIVDELDPMKLLWDWSYAWDSVSCALEPGTAVLEIVTTGPTAARRCLDCICLTSDETHRPSGREQPPMVQGLVPVRVQGDVEWTVGQLPGGGWLIGLFNNRGITKPQHGVLPTDHGQAQAVRLAASWPIARCEEWMTGGALESTFSEVTLTVPAGVVRLVALYPGK